MGKVDQGLLFYGKNYRLRLFYGNSSYGMTFLWKKFIWDDFSMGKVHMKLHFHGKSLYGMTYTYTEKISLHAKNILNDLGKFSLGKVIFHETVIMEDFIS